MTLENTPWMLGGGAVHTPAIARVLAYAATSGSEGVGAGPDMRVSAYPLPEDGVLVSGGVATILGTYPGQYAQSYVARNLGDARVAIPGTGASARSDLIVIRIDDPEYSGVVVNDVYTYPFVRFERIANVPAGSTKAPTSVLYPHVVLARIDIPADTSAINGAMVKDLRKVATPRKDRSVYPKALTGSQELTVVDMGGESYPAQAAWDIAIPSWASKAIIVAHWNDINYVKGNTWGNLWVRLGSIDTRKATFDRPTSTDNMRMSHMVADEIAIPANIRGTVQNVHLRGQLATNAGSNDRPAADATSHVVLDIEFIEAPTEA